MQAIGPTSVLIVEDEFLVAMDIEATLLDASWNVVGAVPDVAQALALLTCMTPNAVCLDMNLKGELSTPIAAELKRRRIPFVVLTGYSSSNVTDPVYQGAPVVHKPFAAGELLAALTAVMEEGGNDQ